MARVLRKHINPVLGPVAPPDVQPVHIERVLTRNVAGGAPTVANDALRYMSRMFRMAVRNHWIDRNPAADFDLVDAGGGTRSPVPDFRLCIDRSMSVGSDRPSASASVVRTRPDGETPRA